jgi:pyrimidine-specific ribonucleoside hydrolase
MTRAKFPSVAVVLALLAAGCGSASPTATVSPTSVASGVRVPVILDYSPTVSDVGALVFLATHPRVELIGVTLPGTGESRCTPGVAHTRGILEVLGSGDVPVACGRDDAVGVLRAFPTGWRDRSDTMDLPDGLPNEQRTAPELIADLVADARLPVRIVAVGPLTNLAIALEDHPEIAAGLLGITIMGGAVDVAGNVPKGAIGWDSANSRAEVNFWVDATAADNVLRSGVPITLVPLDATNDVRADRQFFEALSEEPHTVASSLLVAVWQDAPEWIEGGYFLWDELAAAVAVDESVVVLELRSLLVDDDESETAGWSRDDPSGLAVRVAVSADASKFRKLFLDSVFSR